MLRVHTLLKNYDFLCKIKVLEVGKDSSTEPEVCYQGNVLDCPWIYADMVVDTTENGEGLFVCIEDGEPYLGIYVREVKDSNEQII